MKIDRVAGVCILVAVGYAASAPPADARRNDEAVVQEVNARWKGARCTLLFDIPMKKKTDSDGWLRSVWLVPVEGRQVRKKKTFALAWLSDQSLARGGVLPAGTTFVAEGWDFKKPKSQEGIFLELRVEGTSARVRLEPRGNWAKDLDAGALRDVDRWFRMDFLDVSAANERLVDVGTPAPAAPAAAAPAPPTAPVSPADVRLAILGTSTEPLSVAPGRTVEIVLTYEVSGLAASATVEVNERRVVLRDGEELTTLEAVIRRGPGTYRSSQSLTVPATIATGVYEVRARVAGGGAESSGETLFQVRQP